MYIKQFDGIDDTVINDIMNVLMKSNAVTCSIESYDDLYMLAKASIYTIPSGYWVTVDYNKLAKAVYDAGYRKEKKRDKNRKHSGGRS